jgi:TolB protein
MLGRRCRMLATIGLALAGVTALPGAASATFPGEDGRISFARFLPADAGADLWTIKPDGSDPRQLTNLGLFSVFSDWSPDGRHVAFDSNSSTGGERAKALVIRSEGSDGSDARLLADLLAEEFDPAWFPSGRKLVVDADDGPEGAAGQGLFVIPFLRHRPATLDDARRITTNTDGTIDSEPQVSPDGRWIAFVRFSPACLEGPVGCTTAIYKVRRNGRRLQQLTPFELNASAPDWSPDGRWIVFDTGDIGVEPDIGDIRLMRPDGSDMHIVHDGDAENYFQNPSFSPSGKHFVFNRFDLASGPEPAPEVWTSDRNGSDAKVLAASPFGDFKPDWGSKPRKHRDKDVDRDEHEDEHHGNEGHDD